MDGFTEVAIVWHGLVQVRDGSLENVFDDTLNKDMLLGGELGVVEVPDCLQNDVFLELLLLVVLVWIDSNLAIDSPTLSLWEFGLAPESVVQLSALLVVLVGSVWQRLHAVSESSLICTCAPDLLVDLLQSLAATDVFGGPSEPVASKRGRAVCVDFVLGRLIDLDELLASCVEAALLALGWALAKTSSLAREPV